MNKIDHFSHVILEGFFKNKKIIFTIQNPSNTIDHPLFIEDANPQIENQLLQNTLLTNKLKEKVTIYPWSYYINR